MFRFFFTVLLLSACCTPSGWAEERSWPNAGLPVVRRSEFADAPTSGPVWALAQTSDGTRWMGSNLLAAYDGARWETLSLPNAYAFRGLAADSAGRLWVGAIGALGYATRDPEGRWHFTSLLTELQRDGGPLPGDIWHVFALGKGAVFVTTDWILRWNEEKFDCWRRPGGARLQAFLRGDEVLVYQPGVGLLRLGATGEPALEVAETALPEYPVTWHIALPGGAALVGLADSAYRRTVDGQLTLLPELSQVLHGTIPSCAVGLDRDLAAIGTFKNGVVFTTATGRPINALSEASGLGEDSVYSLARGPGATLWTGLGNGAASIEPPDRITAFDPRLGVKGSPIKVLGVGNGACALTSKTVFEFTTDSSRATLAPQPRLWDAAVIGRTLWLGGFGGLWRREGASWNHEYHVSADVPCLTGTQRTPDAVVFVEGYALKVLQPGNYGWVAHDLGQSLTDTPLSLVEDSNGDLWASTLVGGIFCFTWSSAASKEPGLLRPVAHYRRGYGLPADATHPHLIRLGKRLFAFCANEILQLNRAGTAFEPVKELAEFIGLSATPAPETNQAISYWLVRSRLLGPSSPPSLLRIHLGETADSPLDWKPVQTTGLDAEKQGSRIDLIDSSDGPVLWVADNLGWLRLPMSALAEAPPPPAVLLQDVQSGPTRLTLGFTSPLFPAKTRHLVFRFRAERRDDGTPVYYQTRLNSADTEWSPPTLEPFRGYDGLAWGNHVFAVRALDRFGRPSPQVTTVFTIEMPWYRRPSTFALYALSAALIAAALVRWRSNQLRRQNQRLNQLVTERTRELELSNTAKSEFLENVSHEIRNPLNGLSGMLELLQDGELKPQERELARSLKACAENLTRVSEEVLGYSKLEYGYVSLQAKPFAVDDLFRELVDLFRSTTTRSHLKFEVVLADGFLDGFVGDVAKIKTILGNFIGNALKYAPSSDIELRAEAFPTEGGMVDLFFEVTDHGPGVPAAEQELIFQKFVRGSSAKKSEVPGTGLGLATCRMLAKAMNGSVGLESPASGGATFYLRVLVPHTARETLPAVAFPATPPSAPCRRALIVEDEVYNQRVLQGVALELGYAPTAAARASEAIAALTTADFEVVFLDWELSGSKGGEVARHVRKGRNGTKTVVIATTAHDSDEVRRRCTEAGMDGFLLKPYSKERIRQMIAQIRASREAGSVVPVADHRDGGPAGPSSLNLEAFALYARSRGMEAVHASQDYISAVETELALLREGTTAAEASATTGPAHRLRALAGLIGAQDLSRLARLLETDPSADRGDLMQELTEVWQRLKIQLAAPPRESDLEGRSS